MKYLTDEGIQILLAQSDGELSDLEDSDFENAIEDNADGDDDIVNPENQEIIVSEENLPLTSKGKKRKRKVSKWTWTNKV